MSEVELKALVTNYNTLKSLLTPLFTLYTQILHALSWKHARLTLCTLLGVTLLLLYPVYLQFTLLAVLTGMFSVSYLSSVSQNNTLLLHKDNLLDPVNFINPVYYSLEPENSRKSKEKVIKDYRNMLGELDSTLKTILSIRERIVRVLCWDNLTETRIVLVVLVFLVWCPAVLPLNILLLLVVLYVTCCNGRCYTAIRSMLTELKNTSPSSSSSSSSSSFSSSSPDEECEVFDSDEEFKDSISDLENQGAVSSMPTQETRDRVSSARDRASSAREISEHLSASACNSKVCTNCAEVVGEEAVTCGFCGCGYCTKCCCNTVTKAQLGVTNPDTKRHTVRVCAECTLNLSASEL